MVRNSKRRAFTIVELVIVIAVIAILAAVMIPTFGGVIESANVSADKQILSTVNSQIAIYTGLGNKIETEADLWKALEGEFNGGSNMTEKFDPRSAKQGYHYWYNATAQKVELLQYNKDTKFANVSTGKMMIVRATSVALSEGEAFAEASPRAFAATADEKENFYFLDKGEANEFSKFFNVIENLSAVNVNDYEKLYDDALEAVANANKANKDLAETLTTRMAVTAILTDKPAIVGGGETITHVYIPENKKESAEDYYLNHSGTEQIKNASVSATIVIPENVKVGDGGLSAFGNVTIKVNVDIENISTVLAADSVSVQATVIVNGNGMYGVEGSEVKVKVEVNGELVNGNKVESVKLPYTNPVTKDFGVVVPEDETINVVYDQYIALNKIQDGTIKVELKNSTLAGESGTTFCQDVKWSIKGETGGATINEATGVVTFPTNFALTEITIQATPVAVNEGQANIPVATKTLKVLKLSNDVTFDFVTTNKTYDDLSVLAGEGKTREVVVKYSDDKTSAKFSDFKFYYVCADGLAIQYPEGQDNFTEAELERLGMPTATVSVDANDSFELNDGTVKFKTDNIKTLTGTVTQVVKITVGQDVYNINVKIEPSIFTIAYPAYENFVYTVGTNNAITLNKLFKLSTFFTDLTLKENDKVIVQPYSVGLDADQNEVKTKLGEAFKYGSAWATSDITLPAGTNYVEISVNDIKYAINVNTVSGNNLDAAKGDSFVGNDTTLVLHSDFTVGVNTDGAPDVVIGDEQAIYGNYFKVTAKQFKDELQEGEGEITTGSGWNKKTEFKQLNKSGYSLISMKGDSSLNQLIIDGPVYPDIAMPSSSDSVNGYFCFGVLATDLDSKTASTTTIRDCYIYGFLSPIRAHSTTLTITDTVLEAGTWSNLWINNCQTVNLERVTTMQDHNNGYEPTIDKTDDTKNVLGMGIYINDDLAGKSLTINLTDVTQYNWFSEKGTDFGGNADLARLMIFAKNDDGSYKYANFIHGEKNDGYVNAAIVYQYIELAEFPYIGSYLGESKSLPNITISQKGVQYSKKGIESLPMAGSEVNKCLDLVKMVKNMSTNTLFQIAVSTFGGAINAMEIPVDVWAASVAHPESEACGKNCEYALDDFTAELPNAYTEIFLGSRTSK